ncbi:MAG: YcaO-like family protein [Acidobacteriia bacterium]|nr:YcaO-like family protein [Terriglobia bacterium]
MPRLGRNTAEYWKLPHLPKYSKAGVVRAVEPGETLRRARTVMHQVGITQVAQNPNMEGTGIPSLTGIRPRGEEPGMSEYNGKGMTDEEAEVSVLMEALEHHAGSFCDYETIVGAYRELSRNYSCVPPTDVIVPPLSDFSEDLEIEWVCGYDLLNQRETLVPLNAVICPYSPRRGPHLFYASTNGLAAGNTLAEALCHGICEVLERDAQAIAAARAHLRPLVRSLAGLETKKEGDPIPTQRIRTEGLPKDAAALMENLNAAGFQIYLRHLRSPAGIAAIDCILVEPGKDGGVNAYSGSSAYPDARVALIHAMSEAIQSQTTCVQGSGEGLPQVRRKASREIDDLLNVGEWVSFHELPSFEHDSIDEDVQLLLDNLPRCGLPQLVVFDMTRPEIGIPVVRVVIPKSETWHVFHLLAGRGIFGPRIAREL